MRLAISLVLAASSLGAAGLPYFSVLSDDAGAWPAILSSIGLEQRPAGLSRVFVARSGAAASPEWPGRVERGSILILEGESSLADLFGFERAKGKDNVKVASLTDIHRPGLSIVWEKGLELPAFEIPAGAEVFARERWSGAPLSAGFRRGAGAVLWVAAPPGERGYERFPYLLQALVDLGLEAPFRVVPAVGVLRFGIPFARGPGLFCAALAEGRDRGAPGSGVAFLRAGCGAGCVSAEADRSMSPGRDSGLRLAGASRT